MCVWCVCGEWCVGLHDSSGEGKSYSIKHNIHTQSTNTHSSTGHASNLNPMANHYNIIIIMV